MWVAGPARAAVRIVRRRSSAARMRAPAFGASSGRSPRTRPVTIATPNPSAKRPPTRSATPFVGPEWTWIPWVAPTTIAPKASVNMRPAITYAHISGRRVGCDTSA